MKILRTEKLEKSIWYNAHVGLENRDGLFENQETNMKERTARDLVMGARVTWDRDLSKCGTVIEKGPQRLAVRWDDPSEGEVSYLFYTEMANIGLAPFRGDLSRSEVGI